MRYNYKSDIMKTFGEKNGTPFLFGHFRNELKTLKIQITEEKGMNIFLSSLMNLQLLMFILIIYQKI